MVADLNTEGPSHAPVHPILGIMQNPPDGGSGVDEVEVETREPLRGGVHDVISPLCGNVPSLWTSVPEHGPALAQGYCCMISSIMKIKLSTGLPRCEMCKSMARIIFHTDVRSGGIEAKRKEHRKTVFDDSQPPSLLDGA